ESRLAPRDVSGLRLIVPRQKRRVGPGTHRRRIAAAVQLHQPGAHCTPLNIADGEALPYGITLSDFDGVMFPGSPLHIYDSDPCVTRQIDFARTAFAAGVPVWGS